jgi:DNA-binding IclR family transcriptional regulator
MDKPVKKAPTYAVASVDHALRIAAMLQLEGETTVSEAADRLGVSRSTAHRLLQMLVYRDFAVQEESRSYRAGPVLQLAEHSGSQTARLRTASLPHLQRLVDVIDESAHLAIRTGRTARFIASVECRQVLRVGSREGMVFPAHHTSGGMLLLAELGEEELALVYPGPVGAGDDIPRPDLKRLRGELARIRRSGFAVNQGHSERGVVAVGVLVRRPDGAAQASVSVSMPSVRYDERQLPQLVAALQRVAHGIETDLASR